MSTRSSGARRSRREPTDSASADAVTTDPAAQARGICLTLLTARSRSRAELAEALRRRGIPEEVGESVLDRLGEVGLIDDAAFAESAVHAGHTHRGLGRRALSAELRRRGVPDGIVRDAVAVVQLEDEERRARELVRRKLRTTTASDPAMVARRLAGMLARKGYSEGLVLRVVRDELGESSWLPDVEASPD